MIPIFSVFVVTNIAGGNVQLAASAISTYLIFRVIFEIIIGRYLSKGKKYELHTIILGIAIISISYIGLSLSGNIPTVLLFISTAGAGIGIMSPSSSSIFSTHLDKNREPYEWGMHDAFVFGSMALATALGGFIVSQYGFRFLFMLAALVNIIGVVPYFLYKSKFI